jgi:hypothetical protein
LHDVGVRPTLIENPDLYFTRVDGARLIPLHRIRPTKPADSQPQSVDRAEALMREAAAGQRDRRPPIRVRAEGETYVIVDGNATFAVAQRHSWGAILAIDEAAT